MRLVNGQWKLRVHPDTQETIIAGVLYTLAVIGLGCAVVGAWGIVKNLEIIAGGVR